jgi:hypothetical protein
MGELGVEVQGSWPLERGVPMAPVAGKLGDPQVVGRRGNSAGLRWPQPVATRSLALARRKYCIFH